MENKVADVPYIVHEAEMARMERVNKRWFWAWVITFVLLVCCVAGFFWYESQWQVVEESTKHEVTQEADGSGANTYTYYGGDYYGPSDGDDYKDEEEPQT